MLYGVNLAFTLLTMVPAWVVYAVFAAPPWFYTLYFLLALLAIPLVPLIVAAVIGTFLALVSSRFKRSSLVNLLVSLALVCGVVVASTMAQTLVENFADIGQASWTPWAGRMSWPLCSCGRSAGGTWGPSPFSWPCRRPCSPASVP